ncbi:MAG: TRAP transporter substrate-binding protein [Reyranella sp.]|nr:TRAP transporter substrate-binding protein [Reyranella sp.]
MSIRVSAILSTLVSLLAATVAHARDFRSSDIHARGDPTVQGVAYMGKLIAERTGGRHNIKSLGQNDPDSERYTIQEIRNGTLDMAHVHIVALNQMVPATIVPTLPFLFKTLDHMRQVLDGPIGEEILAQMEESGIVGLCFYDLGARSFYSADKPIRKAADMSGMKVRVLQSDSWGTFMKALGATPLTMPQNRVQGALKSGLIDAAENNWSAYVASRDYVPAPLYSLTEHSMSPGVVVFSKKVWDGLTSEDQAIIRSAARDSVPYMRKLADEREISARAAAVSAGTQVVGDIDRKSFSDVLKPLYGLVLPDPRLLDMVARIQVTH